MREADPEGLRRFGARVDFGKTATDYATHRAGFPPAFFDALSQRGYLTPGHSAVDLGTGTGTVARGLARHGLRVTGIDPAPDLLEAARKLDHAETLDVTYQTGTAERTGLPDDCADVLTAGQCWHWFDRARAAREAARLLRPGGRIVIAHFDWVPLVGSLVAATEDLILRYNPEWAGAGGTGLYPQWLSDLTEAGFSAIETASFDIAQPYSAIGWRGRIRASAGVAASLSAEDVARFEADLAAMMRETFPQEPVICPHRVWWVTGQSPSGFQGRRPARLPARADEHPKK